MNIFEKIKFIWKKPKVIIVTGEGRKCAKEAIFQVLNQYPQAGKNVLSSRNLNESNSDSPQPSIERLDQIDIKTPRRPSPALYAKCIDFHMLRGRGCPKGDRQGAKRVPIWLSESDLKDPQDVEGLKFLVNKSSLFILVVSHIGDISPDKDFFAGEREKTEEIRKLAKMIPVQNWLVLNFDDETVREIADVTNLKTLTFGFRQGADFQVSDIKLNGGTNFKINYKGNTVPVWMEGVFGKEQIYSALAAVCIGTILDLNLIEISQALKNYHFGET